MAQKMINGHNVRVEWSEEMNCYEVFVDEWFVGSALVTKNASIMASDFIRKMDEKPVLRVKLSDFALEPVRGHETDAGLDLKSPIDVWIHPGEHVKIDTGVAVAIPDGYVGLITSKSGLMLENITARGTIDSSYRGTINAVLFNHGKEGFLVERGRKIVQLVLLPILLPQIQYVDELDETERGDGGFGSTGK